MVCLVEVSPTRDGCIKQRLCRDCMTSFLVTPFHNVRYTIPKMSKSSTHFLPTIAFLLLTIERTNLICLVLQRVKKDLQYWPHQALRHTSET